VRLLEQYKVFNIIDARYDYEEYNNSVSILQPRIIQGVPLATEPGISLMSCQQQFLEKFEGRHPPSKSSIWALSKKLENKETLLDEHTGRR
jgi:hypothetical protein